MPRPFGHVFQREDRPGWYIKYPHPDHPKGKVEKAGASQARAKALLRQRRDQHLLGEDARRGRGATLQQYLPAFLEVWRVKPITRASAQPRLQVAADRLGRRPMRELGRADARRFVAKLRADRKVSPATLQRYRSELSAVWAHALEEGIVTENPWRGLRVGQVPKKPRPRIEPERLERIYAATPPDMRDAVVLLGETGARLGEVADLEWRDVGKDTVTLRHTKSGKPRDVPLTPLALRTLRSLHKTRSAAPLRAPHHVFPSIHADRYGFSRRFGRVMRKAGLEGITAHVLRHAFCSGLRMEGVEVAEIQELAGHASITTTMLYASHGPENAGRRAIRRLARARGKHRKKSSG